MLDIVGFEKDYLVRQSHIADYNNLVGFEVVLPIDAAKLLARGEHSCLPVGAAFQLRHSELSQTTADFAWLVMPAEPSLESRTAIGTISSGSFECPTFSFWIRLPLEP